MSILNIREGGRNGLDGEFFSFLPAVPAVAAGLVGAKTIRKKRKTKYANAETQRLAEAFPQQENSIDQNTILQQLLAESRATLEQRNKSKGKKRAELTGKLRAYDEYIADYQQELSQLRASELKAARIELNQSKGGGMKEVFNQGTPMVEPGSTGLGMPTPSYQFGYDMVKPSPTRGAISYPPIEPDTTEMQSMVDGATDAAIKVEEPKKSNTMLFVGIGVLALVILIMRKK